MCMIVYKPEGVPLPSFESLQECESCNPHGIGYMYIHDGSVVINKGIKNVARLWRKIKYDDNMVGLKDRKLAIHFRMATHGKINTANCHPFPISNIDSELSARYIKCDKGLVHNGVINIRNKQPDKSDTYIFTKEYLANFDWNGLNAAYKLLDDEIFLSDRVLIFNKDGKHLMWGSWNKDTDGCLYSSGRYYGRSNVLYGYGYSGYHWNDDTYDDSQYWERKNGDSETGKVGSMTCERCKESGQKILHVRNGVSLCSDCYKICSADGYEDCGDDGYDEDAYSDYLEKYVNCECCGTSVKKDDIIEASVEGTKISVCLQCYCDIDSVEDDEFGNKKFAITKVGSA